MSQTVVEDKAEQKEIEKTKQKKQNNLKKALILLSYFLSISG